MRILTGIFALVFLSGNVLLAQQVEVGVEGGIRATDDLSGTISSESKRYIVGPAVDIRLPKRFSVEVDALYQRFGVHRPLRVWHWQFYANGARADQIPGNFRCC